MSQRSNKSETHQQNRRPDLSKSSHYRINLFRSYTGFFIFSCWFMLKWFIILETSNSLAIKVNDFVVCIAKEGEYMNLIVSGLCISFYYVIWDTLQSGIFKSNLFHIPPNPHSIRVYIQVILYYIRHKTIKFTDIRDSRRICQCQ